MGKEKVMVITGSSRGIGAGLAAYFCKKGDKVVINYSKSKGEAESLSHELSSKFDSQKIAVIQADISDRGQVRELFRKTGELFGPADVLINNAGINIDKPFLELTDSDWNDVITTNLTGYFVCSQEFAFQFKGNWGNIINIGASTAIHGRKNGANYCSSKGGVISLTKCLALELAPKIAVNCMIPGAIQTEEVMTRFDLYDKKNYQARAEAIPLGRLGVVEDMYPVAELLVDQATYITGQTFLINGGQFMY